jgi:trimeric autotransporter adhesin
MRGALCRTAALAGCLAFLLPGGLAAQTVKEETGPLDALVVVDPRLQPSQFLEPFEAVRTGLVPEVRDGWTGFLRGAKAGWKAQVNRRSGRIESAEGGAIPWVPGRGNQLTPEDVDLPALERIARGFLPQVGPLLGVDPEELVLSSSRSGQPADHLWLVDFDVHRGGLPVEGARVVFRVNNGNLVQFGTESLPPRQAAVPPEQVTRPEALARLADHVGGFSAADTFLDGGSLRLLPVAHSEPGKDRSLALAWQLSFRRAGETGTWRARVDATTGELLEFLDVNHYAQVQGGVYAASPEVGPETILPMPFADVTPVGFADSAGWYEYPGGTVSSSLAGRYVDIDDACGTILKQASSSGRISFDASPGTDCATPGLGGAGNTHAARSLFYHLNRTMEVGRGWLPGNAWLSKQLPAHANVAGVCNAFWNGFSVSFFRSGGGCANAGEIASVALHEYGHGLDANDGNGSSPDFGTGEAYGDFTAVLASRDSCIATGFYTAGNCSGFGDACTACNGVRDIDWARHEAAMPHTVANFTQPLCPAAGGYFGPCGRQGHCESHVMSEALWDLAARDLPDAGGAAAWAVAERLWYLSRATATQGFACNTATSPWSSNGCNTGSLWKTLRAADDDDGNLANGTPHSCHLFAAFNRHGIACAADPGAATCFSACTPPPAPALSAAVSGRSVQLSWTGGGDGLVYDVFRSEAGCGAGAVKIAAGLPGTSWTDTAVAFGLGYSYRVVARPAGNAACSSPPSSCQSVTLPPAPCTPPPAPSGLTAVPVSTSRVDLSWNAVPGATEVAIFRATASGGPYVRVAVVPAPATAWSDEGLSEETTFFYLVRAYQDDCASPVSAAVQVRTARCTPATLYANDFESGAGLSDWTVGTLGGPGSLADWRGIQACAAHSGSQIFRFGGPSCLEPYGRAVSAFAQPLGATGLAVPAGSSRTRLSFWSRWDFQQFESGSLLAEVDGGSWISIPGSAILAGGTNEFAGYRSSFVNTVVDLDAVCDLATGKAEGCAGRVVRVAFNASTDVGGESGWFLDDVQVTTCRSIGCTGTPVTGAAAAAGDNRIQVSWSNGAPPSSTFNVYRALGTCAAPGPFSAVARGVSGTSHLDQGLGGGLRYAYLVTGLNAANACESEDSACVEATATGDCFLPFTFAGLSAVRDPGQATCSLDLSWSPASAPCGGPVTYNVYRSASPGFTPSPENRIATGVTGTSSSDSGTLASGATYFYLVRAVDSRSGAEDGNTVRRSAEPSGPYSEPGTLIDSFEALDGFDSRGWSAEVLAGDADWKWSNVQSQSPTRSWHSPSASFGDRVLVSPPFGVKSGTRLTFWHDYHFELAGGACADGATLEISTNGGATWQVVPDSAFLEGGFTGILAAGNPLQGKRGWCGELSGSMGRVTVLLSAWSGAANARLRWHAAENGSVFREGWYVDSVILTDAQIGGICRAEPQPALDLYALPPCRLLDTRQGGQPLGPGSVSLYTLAGSCGIPSTARALSLNVTAVTPTAAGNLSLYPSDAAQPGSSTVNFIPGRNRSNNAVIGLSPAGALAVQTNTTGTVHLVLDVYGYFEE